MIQKKNARLFIAIEIPAEVQEKLYAGLWTSDPAKQNKIRLTQQRNLHLTLRFLGDVEVGQINTLELALKTAARTAVPFEIRIDQGGAFPNWKQPRILWAGFEALPVLTNLYQEIQCSLNTIGFPKESKPFKPHITLARVPDYLTPLTDEEKSTLQQSLSQIRINPFTVSQITLFQSDLSGKAPVYRIISRQDFGNMLI
jgi:2'-5' RNA ligase